MNTRLAVLADIHGNVWALEAVLKDIRALGAGAVINLGDMYYGPLEPLATAKLLDGAGMFTIKGNQDRSLYEDSPQTDSPTITFVRDQLGPDRITRIRTLPSTLVIRDEIFACHGSPESDEEYLLEEVTARGAGMRSESGVSSRLGSLSQKVVLCGHTHFPRTVFLPDGRIVVNPGSVGLQAYTDSFPFPHAMQAGSPLARYALVHQNQGAWKIEHRQVAYPWDKAAASARKHDREDWARWLTTGKADDVGR